MKKGSREPEACGREPGAGRYPRARRWTHRLDSDALRSHHEEAISGSRLKLTIGAQLKLSALGAKISKAKQQWEAIRQAGSLEVKDFGSLRIREGERWATAEVELKETQEEMVRKITRVGAALLQVVEGFEASTAAGLTPSSADTIMDKP
jgi:hypothetical protein